MLLISALAYNFFDSNSRKDRTICVNACVIGLFQAALQAWERDEMNDGSMREFLFQCLKWQCTVSQWKQKQKMQMAGCAMCVYTVNKKLAMMSLTVSCPISCRPCRSWRRSSVSCSLSMRCALRRRKTDFSMSSIRLDVLTANID